MCGDLEEDDAPTAAGERLFRRFAAQARALIEAHEKNKSPSNSLYSYMDRLFADALGRCLRDANAADGAGYERMAAQSLVFARLAGFLAGHAAPQEDALRKTIEALMTGYAEPEEAASDHDHGHSHDHDHDHGHHH